jgi:hypothetical protein
MAEIDVASAAAPAVSIHVRLQGQEDPSGRVRRIDAASG